LKIRRFREEDLSAVARLYASALGGNATGWEECYAPERDPRLDPEQVHVVEEDGEVRATATARPLEVFVDGRPVPMGGVAEVATHAAYRRRGYAGKLMRTLLRDLRERGTHLSMLWPFSHAFYRVYGWELAGESISYAFKPTDLATSAEQRYVRAANGDDLPALMELHEEQAAQYQLCVRRSEAVWRREKERKDRPEVAVYERDGSIEGYLVYRMSGWREGRGPSREIGVRELVSATLGAGEGLLSFLAALNPEEFEVRLHTPKGRPIHPYLRNSSVKAEVSPEFMLRLVDVEGALKHLRRNASGPLVLEVTDDVLVENTGEYTVGDGKVARRAEAAERVKLDVRQLAQLYAGYLPAEDMARHGRLESGSPKAMELLDELFPLGDPWVFGPDHF
jgi:predicted acetyltransferase